MRAKIRILIANPADPVWLDGQYDDRYGGPTNIQMIRMSDVVSHEMDHFHDYGWLVRWFIAQLYSEEAQKYSTKAECDARVSRVPGKFQRYIDRMDKYSYDRFDSGKFSGGNQWGNAGTPSDFGGVW